MTLRAGTRLGPYEVLRLLGAGGMGEVYLARDSRLSRDVAVKVLPSGATSDEQAVARLRREAQAIAALNHPNICSVHDVGEHEGVPFFVMEHLDGETLAARLGRGALALGTWLEVGLALSDALEAAHAAGVIHRDLKPSNIFLTRRGPKILDFGLAKTMVRVDTTTASVGVLTAPGAAAGTLAYMSPEQLKGEGLDPRSDVFSLGVVLYEMATGRRAFDGSTSAVIATAILHDEPPPPRSIRGDLPHDLDRIVTKALEKDRELRYQSATEIRTDLKRLRRDVSVRQPTAPDLPAGGSLIAEPADLRVASSSGSATLVHDGSSSTRASSRGFRRHWGVFATLTVVAAAILVVVLWRRGPAQPTAGSTAFPYLQLQPLTFSGDIQSPAISPDGRFVTFIRQQAVLVRQVSASSADQDVQLAPRVEGRAYESPTITPNGESVDFIVTEGATRELWRVPLLGGSPRPIVSGVSSAGSWSPDGRTIAFIRNEGQKAALVTMDASGGNQRVLALSERDHGFKAVRPTWSPDGHELLVVGGAFSPTMDAPRLSELVFVDARSGAAVRRIPNAEREVWKAWWLDANRLILEAGGGFFMTLWAANLRGEEWTPLTREFAALTDFDATPDRNTAVAIRSERRTGLWSIEATGGTARLVVDESGSGPGVPALDESGGVLYSALLNDGTFGVYRVAPNTTRSVLVASGVLTLDSWSVTPDGRIVVFTGREAPYPLRRVNVDGSGLTTLVPSNGGAPSITPDGRTVIFSPAAPGILSVPIDGGPVTKVSDRPICCPPVISPDGRRMIVPTVGRETTICELPDCSRAIALRLQVPVAPAPLRWAPDGHGIAFVPANDSANIWVQPLDGGTPRRITTLGDLPILDFSWSRDGTRLVMSRGRYHTDLVILKGLLHAPSR